MVKIRYKKLYYHKIFTKNRVIDPRIMDAIYKHSFYSNTHLSSFLFFKFLGNAERGVKLEKST